MWELSGYLAAWEHWQTAMTVFYTSIMFIALCSALVSATSVAANLGRGNKYDVGVTQST